MRAFEFCAGSLSLNFVDTVENRGGASLELLRGPAELASWANASGVLSSIDATVVSLSDVENARVLREAIYRGVLAAIKGSSAQRSDTEIINAAAARPPARPQLLRGKVVIWAERPVQALLSMIAADAIERLSERERLRSCPGCQMLFYDASPPGRRIWCSSASGCGNQHKLQRQRKRKLKGSGSRD